MKFLVFFLGSIFIVGLSVIILAATGAPPPVAFFVGVLVGLVEAALIDKTT